MDVATARWLVSGEAAAGIAAAVAEPEPTSLGAATRLRRHLPPEHAAAVLELAAVRRRAVAKLGVGAAGLFLTAAGLEQATRPAVASWRAARAAASGIRRVVDLGCGLGLDALAFAHAGLEVVGVERDQVTAVLARANLASAPPLATFPADSVSDRGRATAATRVVLGDAESAAADLLDDPESLVYCDPARRTERGRSWDVADLSPSWEFVDRLLDGSRPAVVKLGPGLPHRLIPAGVEACWVSHHGDVVEVSLWAGFGDGATGQGRRAVLLGARELQVLDASGVPPLARPVGAYLYEPDGAVIRAGAIGALCDQTGAAPIQDGIAYLTTDVLVDTPFATAFEVVETLPYAVKALKSWVRDRGIGTLEIKKRGIDVDPAALRRQLRPSGPESATLVLSPTPGGARALVVRRL